MESTFKRPLQEALYCSTPFLQKAHLETTRRNQLMYDVIIIGAGVTGCAVARELSRYKVNVCVLDKEEDVCSGTSKANSAIVHANEA